MKEIDLAEKELLSILVLNSKIGFDLLQIRPKHLSNKTNQMLMEAIIESYQEQGVVDITQITSKSGIEPETIIDIVSDAYLPITDTRKQFMICQECILTDYKKRVINYLIQKMNLGEISCDEYLKKLEKVGSLEIRISNDVITESELRNGISVKKQRIQLKNFPTLDKILELTHNEFLIVGASTGVGKSGLLLNFMNDLMDRYQCIYFNMEMSKSTIYKRMISIKSNVPMNYIEKQTTDYQANIVQEAINEIVKSKVIVEHKATYLHEIRNVLKTLKNDNKHTILFLDHVGLIQLQGNKTQYERATVVAKELRQLCLDYDCTIIAACQLNRASYSSDQLTLSMLKDSGEWENSGSKIIFLYPQDEKDLKCLEPKMILQIAKNRDGQLGKVICKYYKPKQIFKEEVEWKK